LTVPASDNSQAQNEINHPRQEEMDAYAFNQSITDSGNLITWEWYNTSNLTKSGNIIICEWYDTVLKDNDGEVIGFLSIVQDITERVEVEKQLTQYAYYDALTNLPTTKFLEQRLSELLETKDRGPQFALFNLDIVEFKTVKYSFGPNFAEQLLVAITQRLTNQLPPNTLLARIGTDEFAILFEAINTFEQAQQWMEQIQQWFDHPFQLNHQTFYSKINLGLVLSSQCRGSSQDLLQAADTAMHQAKFSNTKNAAVFDPNLQESAIARVKLDSEMRQALQQRAFQVHYQPIVNFETQQISGFEALLRWPKEQERWVSPGQFIPVAEETGFIVALDRWILRQACWQMQQWWSSWGNRLPLWISVNVSAVNLIHPHFLETIDGILQETGLAPH